MIIINHAKDVIYKH